MPQILLTISDILNDFLEKEEKKRGISKQEIIKNLIVEFKIEIEKKNH